MKVGDTVRYLNATGSGKVTRIEGAIAYVEEDGFETPMLVKELVVVLPAGHERAGGARLMFDQSAYDAGRGKSHLSAKGVPSKEETKDVPSPVRRESPKGDVEGEAKVRLLFEPTNVKQLDKSRFAALLVNDSPYHLTFCVSTKGDGERKWRLLMNDVVAPEEIIEVADLSHEDLPGYEQILVQGVFFSEEARFAGLAPLDCTIKVDTTKFHKFHCFREGKYSDVPVLELSLDRKVTPGETQLKALEESFHGNVRKTAALNKGGADSKRVKKVEDPASNPHKLLPLQEIDLHIHALTDSTAGMEPKDMLEMQLGEVRKVMEAHKKRKGQKIVFIHGKGEGVLRKEVLKLLRSKYPTADLQDASFREYGFGATLVTI